MIETPDVAALAATLGDPARARMLSALLDGRALTATELALEANVAPSTASSHLSRLHAAGIVAVEAQGRHRYFRLAGPDVGEMLEGLMGFAAARAPTPAPRLLGPKDPALRTARVCYDHLAGQRAVQMLDSLRARALIADRDGFTLTAEGRTFFTALGIDVETLDRGRRPLCRPCLDWSERRPHLGGALGAALLRQLYEKRWAGRVDGSRAVTLTPRGESALARLFPGA